MAGADLTLVTGQVRLPYGEGGSTGADGHVSFTQSFLGSRAGAIFVPATISTPLKQGAMAPVELTPGIWKVLISVDGRSYGLDDVLVEGEDMALTAGDLLADGTYTLTLEKSQSLTHVGDGTYEIGDK